MDKLTTLAFIVWAIDVDGMSLPVTQAWEVFQRHAINCKNEYTNPNNWYANNRLLSRDPIDFFVEHVLTEAHYKIDFGLNSYGKYNKDILNYRRL